MQIPDKALEYRSRGTASVQDGESSSSSPQSRTPSDVESDGFLTSHDPSHINNGLGQNGKPASRLRRLSTFEDGDDVIDPESGKTRSRTTSLP